MNNNQSDSRVASEAKSNSQTPIYLNVYNFWSCFNKTCGLIGINVYHTGIQIFEDQYLFFGFDGDQTGVGFIQPKTAAYDFSEQILLGYTNFTYFQFDQIILDPLRLQFTGNKYDLLNNNCNHFAKRLAQALNVGHNFPQKIFSVTKFFDNFRCCIPNCILNGRLDWFSSSDQQQSFQSEGFPQGYKELNEEIHKKPRQSSRIKKWQDNKNKQDNQETQSQYKRVQIKNNLDSQFNQRQKQQYKFNQRQKQQYKAKRDNYQVKEIEMKENSNRPIQKKPIFGTVNNSNKSSQNK